MPLVTTRKQRRELIAEECTTEPLKRPEEWVIGCERGSIFGHIKGRAIALGIKVVPEGVLVHFNGMVWAKHTQAQQEAFLATIDARPVVTTRDGRLIVGAAA